jgi:hypothetical protein
MAKVSNQATTTFSVHGLICSIAEKGDPSKGTYCFATTNVLFWAKREAWEIPREKI